MPARLSLMRLFKSREPNTFHYVTTVTYNRVKIFIDEAASQIFVNCLDELRSIHPFKLIGYVIMPDHVHLILNPLGCDISLIMRKLKGKSAKLILDHLRRQNKPLNSLELNIQDRNHAVWQKEFSSIDLTSLKFIRQKLGYIHMNPVRAGFCDHPAKWRWSSYHAYLPHQPGEVPLEMDQRAYWTEEEFAAQKLKTGGQARL